VRREAFFAGRNIVDMLLFDPLPLKEAVVCEKCKGLDAKIEHYRRIASNITDQLTVDRIAKLIGEMEELKVAFHTPTQG
jgi:hypothetical protein